MKKFTMFTIDVLLGSLVLAVVWGSGAFITHRLIPDAPPFVVACLSFMVMVSTAFFLTVGVACLALLGSKTRDVTVLVFTKTSKKEKGKVH